MKILLTAIITLLFAISCSTASSKIYSVNPELTISKSADFKSATNVFLQIKAARHLRQTYIIDKTSTYEMSQSLYAKWEMPPDDIVKDTLAEAILKKGLFKEVKHLRTAASDNEYSLTIDLKDFSRLREKDVYYSSLSFKTTLKAPDGKVIYQKSFSNKHPLKDKSYHALAETMSMVLSDVYGEFLNDVQMILLK